MFKKSNNASIFNLSMQETIVERRPDLKGTLDIFNSCVPCPLDRKGELAAIVGASMAIDRAVELLITPSPRIMEIQRDLSQLAEACRKHYKDAGLADNPGALMRSLRRYPVWSSLVTAGFLDRLDCNGAKAAQGVNLALAWIGKKKMAQGYMRRIEDSLPACPLTPSDILTLIVLPASERSEVQAWLPQCEAFLAEFWTAFDLYEHKALLKKTFEQKVQSEWRGRVAFPGPKRRAAVLTASCMSRRQVTLALTHPGRGIFGSHAHREVAHWFCGFSGLNVQTVHQIPFVGPGCAPLPDDWSIYYHVPLGILFRDYSSLAKDAATAEGLDAQPASYIFPTPAPLRVAQHIRDLVDLSLNHNTLCDLLPELRDIQPEWLLYQSTETLKPSWAKWAKTPGPLLKELGIDGLLAALLSGDLGMSARSKLYYCHIEAREIWEAAIKAYDAIGLGEAVPMP